METDVDLVFKNKKQKKKKLAVESRYEYEHSMWLDWGGRDQCSTNA